MTLARECSHSSRICRNQQQDLCEVLQEGVLPGMVEARYASYTQGLGQKIRAGKVRPWFLALPHASMPPLASLLLEYSLLPPAITDAE